MKKKGKEKRNDYSVIEQNALSGNYMENILKGSRPKITGLTGQVHDQTRHCPLTGRYFEPCKGSWIAENCDLSRENIPYGLPFSHR